MNEEDNLLVTSLKYLDRKLIWYYDYSGFPQEPSGERNHRKIHQVLGKLACTYNLQETYVDDTYLWMGTLSSAVFSVRSMYHRMKGKSTGQIFFDKDMILPINDVADWRYIRQRK